MTKVAHEEHKRQQPHQEKTVRTISWKQEKKLTQDTKVKKTTDPVMFRLLSNVVTFTFISRFF